MDKNTDFIKNIADNNENLRVSVENIQHLTIEELAVEVASLAATVTFLMDDVDFLMEAGSFSNKDWVRIDSIRDYMDRLEKILKEKSDS